MNKVILMGRLSKDPDVRYGNNNTPVARFSIACDRKVKREGEPTADFINVIAFNKTAEFVEKYWHKGMKMTLVGRIQTGSYVSNEGKRVYTTDVIAEECEFAESKSACQTNEPNGYTNSASMDFLNLPDNLEEELPFN